MEQVQIQAPIIREIIDASNQFYQELLGYKPEQTYLQQIPENQWNEFAKSRGLNPNSSGIYLPRTQQAIIQGEDPLNLFHEYFGHGLYCEQSLTGRRLVELERRLLEVEREAFRGKQFTLDELKRFREENGEFKQLEQFRRENIGRYELFAIWTEYLLSKEFGFKEDFERRCEMLNSEGREAIESVLGFSGEYGPLATIYAQGMARIPTPKRIKGLLEDIYGKEAVRHSKLILLTGSKKPFSDIDLFASSNYLKTEKNNWLDLVSFEEKDFDRRIKLFEVQVTHPVIAGEFISGDRGYFIKKQEQLRNQPITEEAIQHNLTKAKRLEEISRELEKYPDKKVALSYSQTYLANALALREGKRLFTKDDLLLYSKRASVEDDKPLQSKGGKEDAT